MNFRISKKVLFFFVALAISKPISCPAMEKQQMAQQAVQLVQDFIKSPEAQAITKTMPVVVLAATAVNAVKDINIKDVAENIKDRVAKGIESFNQPPNFQTTLNPNIANDLEWDAQSDASHLAKKHGTPTDSSINERNPLLDIVNQEISLQPAPVAGIGGCYPVQMPEKPDIGGCGRPVEVASGIIGCGGPKELETTGTKGCFPILVQNPLANANFQNTEQPEETPAGSDTIEKENLLTPEDIVRGVRYKKSGTGIRIYAIPGSDEDALKYFEKMGPTNIEKTENGQVGTLPDGKTANVRTESTDGRTTIEIYDPGRGAKGRCEMKIRFDPPGNTQPQQGSPANSSGTNAATSSQSQAPTNSNSNTNLAAGIFTAGPGATAAAINTSNTPGASSDHASNQPKNSSNIADTSKGLGGNSFLNSDLNQTANAALKPNAFQLGQDTTTQLPLPPFQGFPAKTTPYFTAGTEQGIQGSEQDTEQAAATQPVTTNETAQATAANGVATAQPVATDTNNGHSGNVNTRTANATNVVVQPSRTITNENLIESINAKNEYNRALREELQNFRQSGHALSGPPRRRSNVITLDQYRCMGFDKPTERELQKQDASYFEQRLKCEWQQWGCQEPYEVFVFKAFHFYKFPGYINYIKSDSLSVARKIIVPGLAKEINSNKNNIAKALRKVGNVQDWINAEAKGIAHAEVEQQKSQKETNEQPLSAQSGSTDPRNLAFSIGNTVLSAGKSIFNSSIDVGVSILDAIIGETSEEEPVTEIIIETQPTQTQADVQHKQNDVRMASEPGINSATNVTLNSNTGLFELQAPQNSSFQTISQHQPPVQTQPINLVPLFFQARDNLHKMERAGISSDDILVSLPPVERQHFQNFVTIDKNLSRIETGINTGIFLYQNPELIIGTAKMAFNVAAYPFKLAWDGGFNYGKPTAYLNDGPAESNIQDVSLSYNDAYARYISRCLYVIEQYANSQNWKIAKQTKATLTLKGGQPYEIAKESSQTANNIMHLLQLPPEHAQHIQADAEQYQRNRAAQIQIYNGMPTTAQFLFETCLNSANIIHQSCPGRIAFARAAKQNFDNKNFAAAESNILQALGAYNNEKKQFKLWILSRNSLAEPNQRINQAYGLESPYGGRSYIVFKKNPDEKASRDCFPWKSLTQLGINADNFKQCQGTPFNHLLHEELLEKINKAEYLSFFYVNDCIDANKNLFIRNAIPLIFRILEEARRNNHANNVPLALAIANFGDALRTAEKAAADIHHKINWPISGLFKNLFNWNLDYDAHFRERLAFTMAQATPEQLNALDNSIKTAIEILKVTVKTSGGNDQHALNLRIMRAAGIIELLNTNPLHGEIHAITFLGNILFGENIPAHDLNVIITREHNLASHLDTADKRRRAKTLATIFGQALRELYADASKQSLRNDRGLGIIDGKAAAQQAQSAARIQAAQQTNPPAPMTYLFNNYPAHYQNVLNNLMLCTGSSSQQQVHAELRNTITAASNHYLQRVASRDHQNLIIKNIDQIFATHLEITRNFNSKSHMDQAYLLSSFCTKLTEMENDYAYLMEEHIDSPLYGDTTIEPNVLFGRKLIGSINQDRNQTWSNIIIADINAAAELLANSLALSLPNAEAFKNQVIAQSPAILNLENNPERHSQSLLFIKQLFCSLLRLDNSQYSHDLTVYLQGIIDAENAIVAQAHEAHRQNPILFPIGSIFSSALRRLHQAALGMQRQQEALALVAAEVARREQQQQAQSAARIQAAQQTNPPAPMTYLFNNYPAHYQNVLNNLMLCTGSSSQQQVHAELRNTITAASNHYLQRVASRDHQNLIIKNIDQIFATHLEITRNFNSKNHIDQAYLLSSFCTKLTEMENDYAYLMEENIDSPLYGDTTIEPNVLFGRKLIGSINQDRNQTWSNIIIADINAAAELLANSLALSLPNAETFKNLVLTQSPAIINLGNNAISRTQSVLFIKQLLCSLLGLDNSQYSHALTVYFEEIMNVENAIVAQVDEAHRSNPLLFPIGSIFSSALRRLYQVAAARPYFAQVATKGRQEAQAQAGASRPGITSGENGCYFNATMQCLTSCLPTNLPENLESQNPVQERAIQVLRALIALKNNIEGTNGGHVPANALRTMVIHSMPREFQENRQEDAGALLTFFLDQLADPQRTNCNTFNVMLQSITTRPGCPHQIPRQDPRELFLALDIDENAQAPNLQSCLNNFFAGEQHIVSTCDECHVSVTNATKQLQAINLPQVLVLQLKRFRNDRTKIETPVSFPIQDFVIQTVATADGPGRDVAYELTGIIQHAGIFGTGHYISYVNHNRQWYRCDDRFTQEATPQDIIRIAEQGVDGTFHPYILFYKQTPNQTAPTMGNNNSENNVETQPEHQQPLQPDSSTHDDLNKPLQSHLSEVLEQLQNIHGKLVEHNPTPKSYKRKREEGGPRVQTRSMARAAAQAAANSRPTKKARLQKTKK